MYPLKLLFYTFLFLSNITAFSQRPDLRFKHISTSDGLSHSNVKSIIRDYQGFMWFGSAHGLNKYDGYEITSYYYSENDSSSLISNDIKYLYEDSQNVLWVVTIAGLNRYDRANDCFIKHNEFGNDVVHTLYEDSKGNLWATAGYHLFQYNPQNQKFEEYISLNAEINDILENSDKQIIISADKIYLLDHEKKSLVEHGCNPLPKVSKLFKDSNDQMWMLSYGNGVYVYNPKTKKTVHFNQSDGSGLINNTVTAINEDKNGNIWIGTLQIGLMIYNPKSGAFYSFKSIPGDDESLGFNSIKCIYRDLNDQMWIGTYSSGVDFVTERKFGLLKSNPFVINSLNNNSIIALSEDHYGNLLIGTDGGGLNIYNPDSKNFEYFTHNPKDKNSIGSDIVSAVMEDSKGNLWLGCWDAGLNLLDRENNTVTKFLKDNARPESSLLSNSILFLMEDKDGYLWIGSQEGLSKMNLDTYEIHSFPYHEEGLKNYINCIAEAENDYLWLGSWSGLALFNKNTNEYKWFKHETVNPASLSDEKIFTLYNDSNQKFWIGTSGGLNLFNDQDSTFKVYRIDDGLPSNAIYGILEDEKGFLWLSTSKGISRFDPENEIFTNFTVHDGLQDNQFKEHAYEKLKNGQMAFGGINGINLFYPENISINKTPPQIAFTDFKIFNESVSVGEKGSPLGKNISLAEEINLSYKQSVIAFEFAALNYISPENNQYAYILEGFDKNWNQVGKRRSAIYTNLKPGSYTFKVIASNNDNVWNKNSLSVKLNITPPFWSTWWFKTIIFFLLVSSIGFAYLLRIREMRNQKIILEQKVSEQTAELREATDSLLKKNKELDNFAYIVSHDLKAPLRAIGTLSSWIEKDFKNSMDPDAQNIIQHLKNSVLRMQKLIDGILTYSRAGRIEMSKEEVNVDEVLQDVLTALDVPEKYQVKIHDKMPKIVANYTGIHQIFSNLISNAVKYHDKESGKIEIFYSSENKYHQFSVKDDGSGIDPDHHEKIFEIFQTLRPKDVKDSTGIGLSIVKKLVEELGGDIWVESDGKSGSNFIFTIKK